MGTLNMPSVFYCRPQQMCGCRSCLETVDPFSVTVTFTNDNPVAYHTVCQPPTSNWHKIRLIHCFSVFLLYVAWKRGLPRKFARFVLFRPVKKRSFNPLRVLDLTTAPTNNALDLSGICSRLLNVMCINYSTCVIFSQPSSHTVDRLPYFRKGCHNVPWQQWRGGLRNPVVIRPCYPR